MRNAFFITKNSKIVHLTFLKEFIKMSEIESISIILISTCMFNRERNLKFFKLCKNEVNFIIFKSELSTFYSDLGKNRALTMQNLLILLLHALKGYYRMSMGLKFK